MKNTLALVLLLAAFGVSEQAHAQTVSSQWQKVATPSSSGSVVAFDAANILPSGYYMLFLSSSVEDGLMGTPAIAKMIQVL